MPEKTAALPVRALKHDRFANPSSQCSAPHSDFIEESREILVDTFWRDAVHLIAASRKELHLDPWLVQPYAIMSFAEEHGLIGISRDFDDDAGSKGRDWPEWSE